MTNATPFAKRSLGQHWLRDSDALRAICDAAEISGSDTVLEIGPGLGTLTELLVERAKQVTAVEFDTRLARELPGRVPTANLTVAENDILQFDLRQLPSGYKVVANIPYYLTSNLIRVLSESANPPARAVLLIQKEVAERVVAKPGDMSMLSVSAQFYWEVSLGRVVLAELFTPPPKVDSQILVMKYRTVPLFPDVDARQFFRIVKAGYAGRRKTLLNSLSAGLHFEKQATRDLLAAANIQPSLRAQNLSLADWYQLYKAWEELQAPTT